jgi:hypothetical protein
MSQFLFYLTPLFMGIAFLASLTLFFQRNNEPYLRFFPFFMLINMLGETFIDYMAYHSENNVLIGSLLTVFAFAFYLYTLRGILHGPKVKRVMLYIIPLYLALSLANIFLLQKENVFHSMTYSLGCLLIVGFCIYYFWELFQRSHSVNLIRQPAFWICSGLLFYYVCTFPLFGLLNFIKLEKYDAIVRNLITILVLLNIFLYLSFTIAFLCRLKIRKSMS